MHTAEAAEAVVAYLDAGAEALGRSRHALLTDTDWLARVVRRLAVLSLRTAARCQGASWSDLHRGARRAGVSIRSTTLRKYHAEAKRLVQGTSTAAIAMGRLLDMISASGAARHALGMGAPR